MRKILILLLLFPILNISGNTYYISTTGNDFNPGTFAQPWATWQKGFNIAIAGDIVYIRGGVYNITSGVYINGKNGTESNRIIIQNYLDEIPILDGSAIITSGNWGLALVNCDYWTLKGLIVQYIPENSGLSAGFYFSNSDYITCELCTSRYNEGPGFQVNGFSDYGYFINCDAHHNEDYYADNGGYADGFIASHYGSSGGYHTFWEGCRSWSNSDDGFDRYASDAGNKGGYMIWQNCWAWDNGRRDGDGSGFKWGATQGYELGNPIQITITNCLSFNNITGIDQSECEAQAVLYNNTVYNNSWRGFYNNRNTICIFRNNISYNNTGGNWTDQANFIDDHNTWNGGVIITDVDFLNLDITGVDGIRDEDGSLPILNLFKLSPSSDLINAGINVGLPYYDNYPDIGAYEYEYSGDTYYIDPAGNDGTGDGSYGNPWKTLDYACDHVMGVGDIIHVNAGTYTETGQCNLKVNVSIEGVGILSHIISAYVGSTTSHSDGVISLVGGTNISQSISRIYLDGNMTGNNGINVYTRDNVEIKDCIILDFKYIGVYIWGAGSEDNSFHDNILTNCGGCIPAFSTSGHHPNLYISNQTDFLCYNNEITQTARVNGSNGEGISGYEGSSGLKIFNNTILVQPPNGLTWMFSIELWDQTNCEVYGNTISSSVNFAGNSGNNTVDFHHNTVGFDALHTLYNDGIQFENRHHDIHIKIRNNYFKSLERAIYFYYYNTASAYLNDVEIFNNIFYNIGRSGATIGSGILFETGPTLPNYIDDIDIYNNTIVGSTTATPTSGIFFPSGNTLTYFTIRNNIIKGFSTAAIYENQTAFGSMNYLWIENNLFYDNGHANTPYLVDWTPSNYTYQNNVIDDPDFISATDFHLLETSPAIGVGYNFTLSSTDYDNETWDSPPSIGAYEFIGEEPPPPPSLEAGLLKVKIGNTWHFLKYGNQLVKNE